MEPENSLVKIGDSELGNPSYPSQPFFFPGSFAWVVVGPQMLPG